jgi:hypothetical protein
MMLACTPGGLHHLHAQQVQTKSAVKVRASRRPNPMLYTICSCTVQSAMNTLAYRWPDWKNFAKLDEKVGIPWVRSPALQVELRHAMRNNIFTPPLLDGLGTAILSIWGGGFGIERMAGASFEDREACRPPILIAWNVKLSSEHPYDLRSVYAKIIELALYCWWWSSEWSWLKCSRVLRHPPKRRPNLG